MKTFYALVFVQAVIGAVITFGDIGFDKPGRFGLDFDHLLLMLVVFAVCWLGAFVLAVRRRSLSMLATCLVLPAVVAVAYYGYGETQTHSYPAGEYQHLVGMTEAEVEAELGEGYQRNLLGFVGAANGIRVVNLRGMDIHYSQDGIVVAVEPNNW